MEILSLFLGSLLDSLIGPNLIVPGEPFLLAAGYQLYQGVFGGVVAVFIGGWMGDQASYWIGRKSGVGIQRRITAWKPSRRRNFARARLLMRNHGTKIMLLSRLLGPVSWVVPYLSGSSNISWLRFSLCSLVGLIFGIGQFIVIGYLLASGLDSGFVEQSVWVFMDEHKIALMLLVALLLGAKVVFQVVRNHRVALVVFMAGCCIAFMNYIQFFENADDYWVEEVTFDERLLVGELDMRAYSGRSDSYAAQSINVIYLGESPKHLMDELGWYENQTFSKGDLSLIEYIQLVLDKTPPISDLYWQGEPQRMAFQLPGSFLQRSHMRWWNAGLDDITGKRVWLGAVSYDDGLKVAHYSGIITVLHRIHQDVDTERDKLAEQVDVFATTYNGEVFVLTEPTDKDFRTDYFTDGGKLVISESEIEEQMLAHRF